jgi:predicted nucleotidyltransferase
MAFDTSILDRALREKRGRLERERKELLARVVGALRAVRDRFGIQEAYVVGSLAELGRWRDSSDVDVAVAGASRYILDIMGVLEEATGREVDVIDLDRHPRAGSIRAKGVKVYD